jgi:hypothetical protein
LHWLGLKDSDFRIENGEVKILRSENLKKNLEKWKPKRERLLDAEKNRTVPKEVRQIFETNPFSLIYSNKVGVQLQGKGMFPRSFVPALFRANGFEGQYDSAQARATFMKGESLTKRTLAQLARLMMEKNPSLAVAWKAADPKLYERWALEINDEELRDKADAGSLGSGDINALAIKYQLEPIKFVERIFNLRPSWAKEADADFKNAGSPAGRREEILRATVQRLQNRVPAARVGGPAPIGGPRVPGRPGGEPRPVGAATRSRDVNPAVKAAISSPDDVTVDPRRFLDLLNAANKAPAKKKPAPRKKK